MRIAFVTLGSIQGVMSDLQEQIHDIKEKGSDEKDDEDGEQKQS